MATSSTIRKVALLLVLSTLVSPWVAVAEPGARSEARGDGAPWGLFSRVWNTLVLTWAEAGCIMDPYGRCGGAATPETPENLDAGCRMDPFGRCADQSSSLEPTERMDEGCRMDPYGVCRGDA